MMNGRSNCWLNQLCDNPVNSCTMRGLIILLFLLAAASPLAAQSDYYQRSRDAYKALKTDSAVWYIQQAIRYFSNNKQTDSLALAYVHKGDMAWREQGTAQGLAFIDTALTLTKQLPQYSTAIVAALDKKGQILVNNAQAQEGKQYLLRGLEHIPANAAPNEFYIALYTDISWMYLELQDFANGILYGEKAQQAIERLQGKDSRMLISVYQTLMYLAHDAGNFREAERYGLEMYRLADKHLPAVHANRALAHNDLGSIYESMLRMDEALHHRQEMVRIIQQVYLKNKNPNLLAIGYNNMGRLYEAMGEMQLAHEYYDKGRRLHEKNYGADGYGMLRPLSHVANIKRVMKDFDEADSLFARAYKIAQQQIPNDPVDLAYIETQYGDLFYDRGQFETAARYYQQALQHEAKAGITNSRRTQSNKTTLGQAYAKMKRLPEGLPLLQEGLDNYRGWYNKGNVVIAGQFDKICEAYLDANQLSEAMRYSDSTFLELLQLRSFPAGNWLQKLPVSHFILRYIQHRTAIEQALYKKDGNSARLMNILQLADDYSAYLEKSLPALRTQASLLQLASNHKYIYNTAIEACWVLYQQENKPALLEKAFGFSENSKALLLRLAANNLLVDGARGSKDVMANKDLQLRKRISQLNAQYLDAGSNNDSLLSLLTGTMESYYRFQDSLLQSGNAATQLKYRVKPFSIDEIRQQLLNEKQTLLQYTVTDDYVFLFVLNARNLVMKRLPRKTLEDVKTLQQLYNLQPAAFVAPAYRLYDALVAPAVPLLLSDKLLIVPDADLYYLNFELLVSDAAVAAFNKLPYLIQRYNIAYQLSATSALQYKAAGRQTADKALLLTPVFTDEMKAAYRKDIKDSLLADQHYLSLLRQPFALNAAQQIGRYVSTDLFTGPHAMESTFKEAANRYNILHLGTHAEINNGSPLQSRFFLAKPPAEDSTDSEDGYLHAYEIYGMELRAELAVLTACETGTGAWNQGEGVISLAHSFMYAGCPSVVMSLWKIDEKSSAEIITLFYKHLASGASKSEALRAAKLEYLQKAPPELNHPYFWAGMTLIGDDAPLAHSSSTWLWIAIPVAALLVIGGLIWVRRLRSKKS